MATTRSDSIRWPVSARLTRFGPLAGDLLLAGVFLYAGLSKVYPPGALAESISQYELLPQSLVSPVAHILPWWEIAWAAVLLTRRLIMTSRAILVILLGIYIAAASSAWMRSIDISCGCFGHSGADASWVVVRGGLIIVAAALLWSLGQFSSSQS